MSALIMDISFSCFSFASFAVNALRALDYAGAVFGEADAGDLPACSRREEIAIRGPAVAAGRQTGTATQYILVHHELAVVFADRALGPEVAGVGRVARLRPLPSLAEHLLQAFYILRGAR